MKTLSQLKKQPHLMLPPITLLNASPVTFSLVYPAAAAPYTLQALFCLSFCTCYSPLPAMLFPIKAPPPSFRPCSNATSSDRLLLLSMSKAASLTALPRTLLFLY